MKAIVYREFGPADVLNLEDVEKPVPKDDEVLIKVRAASINPLDWRLMHGKPRVLRLMARAMKMGVGRPGVDVAGEVESVGPNVTRFKPGDAVFGSCRGALADYTATSESNVVKKPAGVTFEQAASINVAGLTALQGLRDKGQLQPEQKVLINGAAGGVGTFAVQIAKNLGAEVAGVCSTRNLELVKSIGADHVIDYTKEDFTDLPERYNVILDCVGNKSLGACKRVLNDGGRCVLVGAPHEISVLGLLSIPIKAIGASLFSSRKVIMFVAKANQDDLTFLGDLIDTGKLNPVIGRQYSLEESSDAMRYLEAGHARGKVIVRIGE